MTVDTRSPCLLIHAGGFRNSSRIRDIIALVFAVCKENGC